MSNFSFLNEYRVQHDTQNNNFDHIFYPLTEGDIKKAEAKFDYGLPKELKNFYLQIGYVFFHKSQGNINRLIDTTSLYQINLKRDQFESDPDLEIYDDLYNGDKLLFYEINEGVYLAIDKVDEDGKNRIYYMNSILSDSLDEFIKAFLANPWLIDELD